jgi:folate/biopterin transporter
MVRPRNNANERMRSIRIMMRALMLVAVVTVTFEEAAAFAPSGRSNQRPTRRKNGLSPDSSPIHWSSTRWGVGGIEPIGGLFPDRATSGSRTRLHAERQQTRTEIKAETKEDEENPSVPAIVDDIDESLSSAQSSPQSSSSIKNWLQDTILLGLEPTPEILAIVTIYFVEGAVGLAQLAKTYLLKDQLHLGPAEMSALSGIFVLPWTIKPLYGFLSDGLPLYGYRRKSYLIAAGLTGGLSYALLGYSPFWDSLETSTAVAGTCVALILSSACIAVSDVVADGIVVTRTRKESANNPALAGSLQSLCWGSSAIGALLASYYSGSLIETLGNRGVFGLTAALPLLVALIAIGVDEERVDSEGSTTANFLSGVQTQAETLWGALQQQAIWRPALFLFLWRATPTSDGAFFYFMTDDLHLGPEFMGRIQLVGAAAGLAGVWLYQQFFRNVNIKDLLFWSTIISFPLGLIPLLLITHTNQALGIPDTALIYGDDVVLSALGRITFMPTLVLAARLCPPGVEAVLFATLMSSFNGAGTLGTEIGAALTKLLGVTDTNFDNLGLLTVICNVSSLFPLFFIGWLEETGGEDMEGTTDTADTSIVDVTHNGDEGS